MRFDLSIVFLVAANLIPIFGVLFLGWSVASILVLYWLENVVIGALNVVKILSTPESIRSKLFMATFFALHFGVFTAVHGMFLIEMFSITDLPAQIKIGGALFWTASSFLLSHAVSMLVNFFGRGEYKKTNIREQMFAPYARIVVMHIVIIVGGSLVQSMGAPMAALIVLIGLKIGIDIAAHNKAHAKLAVTL